MISGEMKYALTVVLKPTSPGWPCCVNEKKNRLKLLLNMLYVLIINQTSLGFFIFPRTCSPPVPVWLIQPVLHALDMLCTPWWLICFCWWSDWGIIYRSFPWKPLCSLVTVDLSQHNKTLYSAIAIDYLTFNSAQQLAPHFSHTHRCIMHIHTNAVYYPHMHGAAN